MVTIPMCVLVIAIMLTVYTCQRRYCAYKRTRRQCIEEPLTECNLDPDGKCLKDLIYDMSTSGSGSGTFNLLLPYWFLLYATLASTRLYSVAF